MTKTVALGITSFEDIIQKNVFYVDKTLFIKEWFLNRDQVTLITRPRRFGKTLTLNMLETFFSNQYAGRGDLFEQFSVWQDATFQQLQGTYPVINVSFAGMKQDSWQLMLQDMKYCLSDLYDRHGYLLQSDKLNDADKNKIRQYMEENVNEPQCIQSLQFLSRCLYKHFGKKVMIFIDEYDTPMLEAYTAGYWQSAIIAIRRMFHAALKDNPYLERGLLTGITRITQESIFSDLNNLTVVTTTTEMYETSFGFTEQEVFTALDDYGLSDQKSEVKRWYDGFQFGQQQDIYNPWSVLNYLKLRKFEPYWMNTSSNSLVGKLVQEGSVKVKSEFEVMLGGSSIVTEIDESITYEELKGNSKTIWSWFLTTGYVKVIKATDTGYEIRLTNHEVQKAFYKLVKKWFEPSYDEYTYFIRMLLLGDREGMQRYMEKVAMQTFSFFDVGNGLTENDRAEQFYHGFTIGLIADLNRTHILTSNRESGIGRYDICIEPKDKSQDGILIEFKLFDPGEEQTLEETANRALEQIKRMNYETDLRMRGVSKIRKYGFAFQGKKVWIKEDTTSGNFRKDRSLLLSKYSGWSR
ncbi:MAG: ATP-binding protein [Clostridiales bacterium]|nr:ATP-binding protein [Clostridiales bacterium]